METKIAGSLNLYGFAQADNVYSTEGICPTILAHLQGQTGHQIQILEESEMLRIRKLTEGECMRLMGFEEKDTEACRKANLSKANIFHQSGDSIVTTVLVGIFGELLGSDYERAISEYADRLHKEVA